MLTGIADLVLVQVTDVFRVGMIAALIVTMLRTQGATGTVLPLIAGVVFIAVMIPMTLTAGQTAPVNVQIAAGLVSNTILLAGGLAIWWVVRRFRG